MTYSITIEVFVEAPTLDDAIELLDRGLVGGFGYEILTYPVQLTVEEERALFAKTYGRDK